MAMPVLAGFGPPKSNKDENNQSGKGCARNLIATPFENGIIWSAEIRV
jgi:hypothetical protein